MPNALVVVGTGIHVGQMTTEARDWLTRADKVLYCVSDAATERLILTLNATSESLYRFYGEGKRRSETYEQMISRTLECVRANPIVVVAYYGHPGFFVYPSHQAIKLALDEGFDAVLLPAVSSFDCLVADLGINVAQGCQIFEATDLMVRQRRIDTSSHVVILQVCSVGDMAYSFKGFDGRNVPSIGEFLLNTYEPDFEATIYHAKQFPIGQSRTETITIQELAGEKVKMISTLYIPPAQSLPLHMKLIRQYQLETLLDGKRLVPVNESYNEMMNG